MASPNDQRLARLHALMGAYGNDDGDDSYVGERNIFNPNEVGSNGDAFVGVGRALGSSVTTSGDPSVSLPILLEVQISSNVLNNAPSQLDLRLVMDETNASSLCSVADLKSYLCKLAAKQKNELHIQGVGTLLAPLAESDLVVEQALGGRGQTLFDHHSLLEASSNESQGLTDPCAVNFPVRVRHRTLDLATDAAERRFHRFELEARFDEDVDFEGTQGGLASDPIGGDRGLGRPEEFFHQSLERFDATMAEIETQQPPRKDGCDHAVFSFIEDCLQDQKTRFETVSNAAQTTSDRAAAFLASAAAGCTDSDSGAQPSLGGRAAKGSAADVVRQFSRAMRDEYATWELFGVLHHHRLLNMDDLVAATPLLSSPADKASALLSLSDKEVVRQLVTLEEDDLEVAHRVSAAADTLPPRCYPCSRSLLRVSVARRWLEQTFRTTTAADFRFDRLNKESRWAKTQQGLATTLKLGFAQAAHNRATASQVASLAPDAPLHNQNHNAALGGSSSSDKWLTLAAVDSEDERDLLADVWRLLRGGQLSDAIEHCEARSSSWRAAMLSGGELNGGGRGGAGAAELYRLLENLGICREARGEDDDSEDKDNEASGDQDGSGEGEAFLGGFGGNACHRGLWLSTCFTSGREFAQDSQASGFNPTHSASAAAAASGPAPSAWPQPSSSTALTLGAGVGGESAMGADGAVAALEGAVLSALAGDAATLLRHTPLPSSSFVGHHQRTRREENEGDWEDKCWFLLKSMEVAAIQSALVAHHKKQVAASLLFPSTCADAALDLTAHGDHARFEHALLAKTASAPNAAPAFFGFQPPPASEAVSPFGGGTGGSGAEELHSGAVDPDEATHLRLVRESLLSVLGAAPPAAAAAAAAALTTDAPPPFTFSPAPTAGGSAPFFASPPPLAPSFASPQPPAWRPPAGGATAPPSRTVADPVLSLSQVFEAVPWTGNAARDASSATTALHHQVQAAAILGPAALEALLLPPSFSPATATAARHTPMQRLEVDASAPPYVKRFAAHLAILLRAVGIVKSPQELSALEPSEGQHLQKPLMSPPPPPAHSPFAGAAAAAAGGAGTTSPAWTSLKAKHAAMDARCDELVLLYAQHLAAAAVSEAAPATGSAGGAGNGSSGVRLVARYCRHVRQRELRVKSYVAFLTTVRQREAREACVRLAQLCFPEDVGDITRRTVEAIRLDGLSFQDRSSNGSAPAPPRGAAATSASKASSAPGESSTGPLGSPSGRMGGRRMVTPRASFRRSAAAASPSTLVPAGGEVLFQSPPDSREQGTGPSSGVGKDDDFFSGGGWEGASGSAGMSARPADLEKIKAIEWLCISEEHKGEAVLQANELLRSFFLPAEALDTLVASQRVAVDVAVAASEANAAGQPISAAAASAAAGTRPLLKLPPPSAQASLRHIWRFDAAELLVLSSSGIASEGGAFPEMVLRKLLQALSDAESGMPSHAPAGGYAAMQDEDDWATGRRAAFTGGAGGSSGGGGAAGKTAPHTLPGLRTARVWARVLKEQQCWRVLLRAIHAHREWKRAMSLTAASHPPSFRAPQRPPTGAPQDEHEDFVYRVQQAAVRHRQLVNVWLSDALETVLGVKLPAAVAGLEALLDFGPGKHAALCFGPTREGERDYSGLVGGVVDALPKAGVDPRGWMFFGADYLHPSEEEGDEEAGPEGGEGCYEKAPAATHQRLADRLASQALRRECLPKAVLLLHEVHHDTGLWLLKAAGLVAQSPSRQQQQQQQQLGAVVAELEAKAANAFRKAMQVADLVASRQMAVYGSTSSADLKRILKAVHASALQLLQLRGRISLDPE